MCDFEFHGTPIKKIEPSEIGHTPHFRRAKLWEIEGSFHCSILGTCLSMRDLHKIASKTKIKLPDYFTDYLTHATFVKSAGVATTVSRLMHKVLDKKYRAAVTACKKMTTVDELRAYWQNALKAGDIPGPYWAIMSHPYVDSALTSDIFGDVHMLSHLVGAANRADLQKLETLKEDKETLEMALENERERSNRIIAEREHEVGGLRMKLAERADDARRIADLEERLQAHKGSEKLRELEERVLEMMRKSERDRISADEAARLGRDQKRRIAALNDQVATMMEELQTLRAERDALEHLAESDMASTCAERKTGGGTAGEGNPGPIVLDGESIVYVGGRSTQVGRFRMLVERAGGQFLHHDGGLEDGVERLEGALARGDVVLCPIDCVSHSACLRAKTFCKRAGKSFVPLRSSGLSSFVAGLRDYASSPHETGPDTLKN